jgi:hypothetical protein
MRRLHGEACRCRNACARSIGPWPSLILIVVAAFAVPAAKSWLFWRTSRRQGSLLRSSVLAAQPAAMHLF